MWVLSKTDSDGVVSFISKYSSRVCLRWTSDIDKILPFRSRQAAESSWMCGFPWCTEAFDLVAADTPQVPDKSANPFAPFI